MSCWQFGQRPRMLVVGWRSIMRRVIRRASSSSSMAWGARIQWVRVFLWIFQNAPMVPHVAGVKVPMCFAASLVQVSRSWRMIQAGSSSPRAMGTVESGMAGVGVLDSEFFSEGVLECLHVGVEVCEPGHDVVPGVGVYGVAGVGEWFPCDRAGSGGHSGVLS